METRIVTAVWKDRAGRIIAIGNDIEDWSPVSTEEAVTHIRYQTHNYVVNGDNQQVAVRAVEFGGRWYLRTARDRIEADNLDELPSLTGLRSATGSFDSVICLSAAALDRVLAEMHASGVIQHQAVLVEEGQIVTVCLGRPHVAASASTVGDQGGNGSRASVSVQALCWVRQADDALAAGYTAHATINTQANLRTSVSGDGSVRVQLNYEPAPGMPVLVNDPMPSGVRTVVEAALERWIVEGPPGSWNTRLPSALGQVRQVTVRVVGAGALQVGLSTSMVPGPNVFPADSPADWTMAISRRQVAAAIYASFDAAFGAFPPPAGSQPVLIDPAQSIYIDLLLVSLQPGKLILSGTVRREAAPVISANFSVSMLLELSNGGLVTRVDAIDVAIVEWYGVLADFLTGGQFRAALRTGLRNILSDDGSGLLSANTFATIANGLLDTDTQFQTSTETVLVLSSGINMTGRLTATGNRGPVVDLQVVGPETSGTAVLCAAESWSRGGAELTSIRWELGDGTTPVATRPPTAAVRHTYPSGNFTATASIEDYDGFASSASVNIAVP